MADPNVNGPNMESGGLGTPQQVPSQQQTIHAILTAIRTAIAQEQQMK